MILEVSFIKLIKDIEKKLNNVTGELFQMLLQAFLMQIKENINKTEDLSVRKTEVKVSLLTDKVKDKEYKLKEKELKVAKEKEVKENVVQSSKESKTEEFAKEEKEVSCPKKTDMEEGKSKLGISEIRRAISEIGSKDIPEEGLLTLKRLAEKEKEDSSFVKFAKEKEVKEKVVQFSKENKIEESAKEEAVFCPEKTDIKEEDSKLEGSKIRKDFSEIGSKDISEERVLSKGELLRVKRLPEKDENKVAFEKDPVNQIEPFRKIENFQDVQTVERKEEVRSEIIKQIVQKIELYQADEKRQQITVELKPEFLGKVKIRFISEHNRIDVQFITDNHFVKETISSHIPLIQKLLENQGIAVNRISLVVSYDERKGVYSSPKKVFSKGIYLKDPSYRRVSEIENSESLEYWA